MQEMTETQTARLYRFGEFEADSATSELRRQGVHIKLNAQPFQVLLMLLERDGEVLTREEIVSQLWPEGTFVDYEHGVNSAINRIREALGDKAGNPRFVETLARRGYRFLAPVVRIASDADSLSLNESPSPILPNDVAPPSAMEATPSTSEVGLFGSLLATQQDLPKLSPTVVQTLFVLLQLMYIGFYVGALANLAEIEDLVSVLPRANQILLSLIVTAAILIPVRVFLVTATWMHAPHFDKRFHKLWPYLLPMDLLWSLSPFLLLHHIDFGLALACTAPLVYSPFAQRSLILMGACGVAHGSSEPA